MPGAGATDYMHLFGLVAHGLHVGADGQGGARPKGRGGAAARMDAKLVTGRFFMERVLPETATASRPHQCGRGHDDGAAGGAF